MDRPGHELDDPVLDDRVPDDHVLDDPVLDDVAWHALSGPQAHLALVAGGGTLLGAGFVVRRLSRGLN